MNKLFAIAILTLCFAIPAQAGIKSYPREDASPAAQVKIATKSLDALTEMAEGEDVKHHRLVVGMVLKYYEDAPQPTPWWGQLFLGGLCAVIGAAVWELARRLWGS